MTFGLALVATVLLVGFVALQLRVASEVDRSVCLALEPSAVEPEALESCAHTWKGVVVGGSPADPVEYDEVCEHCGGERTAIEGVDGYSAAELAGMRTRLEVRK